MIKTELNKIIKNLKMVFFDFDGVFTTNQVIVFGNGSEGVLCLRSDGFGLDMLRELKIEMIIVSTEKNPVVEKRARKLKLVCYSGLENKFKKLKEIANRKKISLAHVAYLGNDINDIECMKNVGLSVAVADAYPEVKKIAKIILNKKGGKGAVREFCELIYNVRKT